MPEAPGDIEETLDRLIARLTKAGGTKVSKALLVDGRRLLTVVRNWRTITPTPEARAEMASRVAQLARSVDAAMPAEPEAAPAAAPAAPAPAAATAISPAPQRSPASPAPQRSPAPAAPSVDAVEPFPIIPTLAIRLPMDPPARAVVAGPLLPDGDEQTRAAPLAVQAQADKERAVARSDGARLDPQRMRTLPDLDISGIAQLVDEGPSNLDRSMETGWIPAPRNVPRGRGGSDPDISRGRPSPPPINGRRRGEGDGPERERETIERERERPASDRPPRPTGRHQRYLPGLETFNDVSGPVYPVVTDEALAAQRATVPARASSVPPVVQRGDKTMIAVRPLPAPEVLDPRLVFLNEPFSQQADAYRLLRRKLSGANAPRTIAVTSAQPGEGKTSCAANLALAFRETSNERVLLVEANLKAPGVAKVFGFEPPVCFARQMAKNRDSGRASWTVAEQFEPLHVLAVDPSSKTSPLLDPVAFANALEQLVEAGYDHIIIDTPPALGGSDMNLIADAVDGIVIVAWIKKSKKTLVKQAIDQLKPATILGVVTLEG